MTNDDMTATELTREEARSALWAKKLAPFLRAEIAAIHEQLESPSLPINETTVKRGEIRFAKRILALADEAGQEARQSEADGPESASPASRWVS